MGSAACKNTVLCRFPTAAATTLTDRSSGRKGSIYITAQLIMKGSEGKDLEAGTEMETMEKRCFLSCFLVYPRTT